MSDTCTACRFESDKPMKRYHLHGYGNNDDNPLCEICSHSSDLTTTVEYPHLMNIDTIRILRNMAYIGNIIIAEIRNLKKED